MKEHRPLASSAPVAQQSGPQAELSELDELQQTVGNAELAARLFLPPAEGEDAGVEAPPGVRPEILPQPAKK